ncbi:MAG: GTP-binding protein, partial [Saprospiraceae bacterium]
IFVLQQKDLMEAEDLIINENGVNNYATKKGVNNAKVFSVSAKMELKEKPDSGYAELRKYIADNITGGKAPILKLGNNIDTSINVSDRIKKGIDNRQNQFISDENFRKDVLHTLEKQQTKSNYQVDVLTENILGTYDRVTGEIEDELSSGLSFFSLFRKAFVSIFSKKDSPKGWIEDLRYRLEHELKDQLTEKLNLGVNDLTDSVSQMVSMIDLKIKNNASTLNSSDSIFSHIANRRNEVIDGLRKTFTQFMNRSENFKDDALLPSDENFSPNIATGSGLAVIGVMVAALAQGSMFDVTGGILTAVGVLFTGVTVGVKRQKIMKGYRKEIEKGRADLKKEVDGTLKLYVDNVKQKVDANFKEFDILLENEEVALNVISKEHSEIATRLDKMKVVLEENL